uniref:Transmembrane protein 255B n=1 Tax=Anas platyrhynchos TaxID=8839 RepID=A0A8B9R1P2_ANAPL
SLVGEQQKRSTNGPLFALSWQFAKRKKTSLWFTVALLVVSTFILTIGLAATTRTENVTVGGYYPGIILGFGSFLGIVGIHLVENRRQMLVASIVFISFGVVAAFCCAIVDGVFAARHIVSTAIFCHLSFLITYVISGRKAFSSVLCLAAYYFLMVLFKDIYRHLQYCSSSSVTSSSLPSVSLGVFHLTFLCKCYTSLEKKKKKKKKKKPLFFFPAHRV